MRVLVLSWEYPPVVVGGLGRHVHALCTALAAAGHEVTVVSRHAVGAAYDEVAEGVRVVRVPEDPPVFAIDGPTLLAWTMAFNHALTRAALAVAGEVRPEVVHAHDWLVAHAAATLKHHLAVPLVASIHATEAGRHQGWLPGELNRSIHSIEWWLTYEARRVITCSQYMRWEVTRLFDLPPGSCEAIPNGVHAGRWRPPPADVLAARAEFGGGPLVLFTGRLVYEKGVHDLLAAIPRLRRRHPDLRVVIAGDGPESEALRAQAKRLRVGRSVVWFGWLDSERLATLAAAADCAVVPSIYEPFGMVALEAAAAGTPTVVADTGGLREIVEHGITGLRFTPGDPAGLADAVTAVLADEVSARRLVRGARAVLDRDYSWPSIAARTVKAYRRAVRDERKLQADLATNAPRRMTFRDGNLLASADRPS
ncbi:MAG TPA: glycosyltransferase family 4 protein [Cryptosporangiaceae bacterium]|nr:glycosyltransferase family 4 protein [Cryptosporangiaceae bacterium]